MNGIRRFGRERLLAQCVPAPRALAGALAAAWVISIASPAAALTLTPHGPVDFGDLVPYRVDGPTCEDVAVAIEVAWSNATVGGTVTGPPSSPRRDGIDPSGCVGAAAVPTFSDVTTDGWQQGDSISISITDGAVTVPLRYPRVEADRGTVAAGDPQVVPAADPDTGSGDMALAMVTGDAVSLGRVDLQNVDSIAFRACVFGIPVPEELRFQGSAGIIQPDQMEPAPVRVTLRQDSTTGPVLAGPIDLSTNLPTGPRLSAEGYGGGCYRLVSAEMTGSPLGDAPEVFLVVDTALPGTLTLNSVDFNGTGAKVPVPPRADPPGMTSIFNGVDFTGWTASGCRVRDGAIVNDRSGDPLQFAGCSFTLDGTVSNIVLRVELRRRDFYDNGGIFLNQEIQLRSAGEYLPGGYFTEYAARWQKMNAWPDWSDMEVIQLGSRYVVTVNGRTVTDYDTGEVPTAYALRLASQPEFSYRTGARIGFGGESSPSTDLPQEWGNYQFRNIRLYECTDSNDPVCTALADARLGQAPARSR